MIAEETLDIARRWIATGELSDTDAETLKTTYGKPLGQCTPCYWNGLRTFYTLKLRKVMATKANPKYIVSEEVGSFSLFGEPSQIVTLGTEREGLSIGLTDELAEYLLEEAPARAQYIIANPDYKKPTEAQLRVAANKAEAERVEKEKAEQARIDAEKAEQEKADKLAALLGKPAPVVSTATDVETPIPTGDELPIDGAKKPDAGIGATAGDNQAPGV